MTDWPETLERTAELVVATLLPTIDADWSVRAGTLEWDVDYTLGHMAGGPAKHALYLASRSPRFIAVTTGGWPDVTRLERIHAISDSTAAVANLARMCAPEDRGFHVTGMHNGEEFCVLGCEELLLHTHDVALGLGLHFEPPAELCRKLLEADGRGLAGRGEPWPTMLWASGRDHPTTSGWDPPPKARPDRVPLEFAQDEAGNWQPVRWLEE